MIEREPFLIRNGLRIFGVFVVTGLTMLFLVGIRLQNENAETQNEENRYTARPPTSVELQASCSFFGGAFLGMPKIEQVGYFNLYQTCHLVETPVQSKQCEFFSGVWRNSACSVDVTEALNALH